jgi:hypothetical protein
VVGLDNLFGRPGPDPLVPIWGLFLCGVSTMEAMFLAVSLAWLLGELGLLEHCISQEFLAPLVDIDVALQHLGLLAKVRAVIEFSRVQI